MRKILSAVSMMAGLSSPLAAQQATGTANHAVGHNVAVAGDAVGVAPRLHEVPAAGVSGTVPAVRPFASGVTGAGYDASKGIRGTGVNISHGGVSTSAAAPLSTAAPAAQQHLSDGVRKSAVNATDPGGAKVVPNGAITPSHQQYEQRAVADSVNHAKGTAKEAADVKCDLNSPDYPECEQ